MNKKYRILHIVICAACISCFGGGLNLKKRSILQSDCSTNPNFQNHAIKTVAVLPFQATKKTEKGEYTPTQTGGPHRPFNLYVHLQNDQDVIPSILEKALIDSGRFKVADRRKIKNILKEIELQQTGLVDDQTLAKVGKLTGANAVISGNNILALSALQFAQYPDQFHAAYIGYLTTELRMTHIETGEVVWVCKINRDSLNYIKSDITMTSVDDYSKVQEYGGPGEQNTVLFVADKALKEAVESLR